MKVRYLNNGDIADVQDEYGARLIEQGMAVAVADKPIMEAPQEPAEEAPEEAEKPVRAKSQRKG